MKDNHQLVFFLYDSRSGSTLCSALLNRYAGVCVSLESAFVSKIIEYPKPVRSSRDVDGLLKHLQQEVQFTELDLDLRDIREQLLRLDFPLSKKTAAETILKTYFERRDPQAGVWLVKHHPYRYIRQLAEMFQGVKFLHIVRDGRAVFASKKSSRSINGEPMEDNLLRAALRWRERLLVLQHFPKIIYEFRYEDLIASPDATLENILDFLEVPPSGRQITKSQKDYSASIGEKQKHLHVNVQRAPDAKINEKWKTALDPTDIYLYEAINADLLASRGYPVLERCVPHPARFYLQVSTRLAGYAAGYGFQSIRSLLYRGMRRSRKLLHAWAGDD